VHQVVLESRWSSGNSSRCWRKLRLGLIAVAVFRSGVRSRHDTWEKLLEYNRSQSILGKTAASESSAVDESKDVILDNQHGVACCPLGVPLLGEETPTDTSDGRLPSSHTAKDSLAVDTLAPRSQSAQDLTKEPDLPSPHHHSAESLLDDRPRTLPHLDRLRLEDMPALSRRRSFSGALQKAASAAAVRYRGLRDSLKARSSDVLTGGGHDKLTPKSHGVSSDNLGQQTTAHS